VLEEFGVTFSVNEGYFRHGTRYLGKLGRERVGRNDFKSTCAPRPQLPRRARHNCKLPLCGKLKVDLEEDYRGTADVRPDSTTETYVALKLMIDNWRPRTPGTLISHRPADGSRSKQRTGSSANRLSRELRSFHNSSSCASRALRPTMFVSVALIVSFSFASSASSSARA
jgi:Glucose-6-phosphate dehydrogenase, C-terminal domain